MLKWLIRRRIAAFEREFGYDSSYAYDILDVSPRALMAFNRIMPMSRYRHDVPLEAWYAAKIATVLSEDCGPCTQLAVTMAERAGVAPQVLRALLNRDPRSMTPDAALGFNFAIASLAHDPAADDHRSEIERRWGKHALVSLAFVIASARVFPTLKYALGHGKTCQRVTVGGAPTPVLRHAA
jgi:hypothetical protein